MNTQECIIRWMWCQGNYKGQGERRKRMGHMESCCSNNHIWYLKEFIKENGTIIIRYVSQNLKRYFILHLPYVLIRLVKQVLHINEFTYWRIQKKYYMKIQIWNFSRYDCWSSKRDYSACLDAQSSWTRWFKECNRVREREE